MNRRNAKDAYRSELESFWNQREGKPKEFISNNNAFKKLVLVLISEDFSK